MCLSQVVRMEKKEDKVMFYGVPRSGKDIIVNDEIKVYVPYGYVYEVKGNDKDKEYDYHIKKPEKRPVGYKDGIINMPDNFKWEFSFGINHYSDLDSISAKNNPWTKKLSDTLKKISKGTEDSYDPYGGFLTGKMIIGHERIHKVVRENSKVKIGYFSHLTWGMLTYTGVIITPKNFYYIISFSPNMSAPQSQKAFEEYLKGVDVIASSVASKSSTSKTTSSKTTTSRTTTSKSSTSKSSTSKASSSKSKSTTSTEEKNKKEEATTVKAPEKINPRMLEYKKAAAAKLLQQEEQRYDAIKTEYEKFVDLDYIENKNQEGESYEKDVAAYKKRIEEINKRIKEVKDSQLDKVVKLNKVIINNEKEIKTLKKNLDDNAKEMANLKLQANKSRNKKLLTQMEELSEKRLETERRIARLEVDNQTLKLRQQDVDEEKERLNRMNQLQLELDTIRLQHKENIHKYQSESEEVFGSIEDNLKQSVNAAKASVNALKRYSKELESQS